MNYQRALEELQDTINSVEGHANFRFKCRVKVLNRILEHPVNNSAEFDVALTHLSTTLLNISKDFPGETLLFDLAACIQRLYRSVWVTVNHLV